VSASRKTTRRSTEEVRALVLRAATQEFAARGYDATTMREVATTADISLSVVYRQFESKERLFAAALLEPFLTFFEEFTSAWQGQLAEPREEQDLMRELVRDLYVSLSQNEGALAQFVMAGRIEDHERIVAELRPAFARILSGLDEIGAHEAKVRGWFDAETGARATWFVLCMASGLVLMRPWLAPDHWASGADGGDEVVEWMARYALAGLRMPPPTD
jgi:AcrR family transcriptional regulator